MRYAILLIEPAGLEERSVYAVLPAERYDIAWATTVDKAKQTLKELWPDLVICNLVGGGLNLTQCRAALQATRLNLPCLLLAPAAPSPNHLETFLPMPCPAEALQQAIVAVAEQDRFVRRGDFTLDTRQKYLLQGQVKHRLTPKPYGLLHLLMSHEGEIVYRKTIIKEVWETDYMGDTRTLDVHVRWIREMIERDPSQPDCLQTVRGVGYRFVARPR